MWTQWWIWIAAGLVMGGLEMLLPGYVLLGFSIGAIVTGGLVWTGILGGSLPWTLVVCASLSLASWVMLRTLLHPMASRSRHIRRDINEN